MLSALGSIASQNSGFSGVIFDYRLGNAGANIFSLPRHQAIGTYTTGFLCVQPVQGATMSGYLDVSSLLIKSPTITVGWKATGAGANVFGGIGINYVEGGWQWFTLSAKNNAYAEITYNIDVNKTIAAVNFQRADDGGDWCNVEVGYVRIP